MINDERITVEHTGEEQSGSHIRSLVYALLLVFAFFTVLTACSLSKDDKAGAQHMHGSETWETTASFDKLPTFLSDYTPHTSDLYKQVHDHMDLMSGINCYCGCMDGLAVETPHDSLLRCYLAEHSADDGSVTWTNHSTSCGICKKEMEDVLALNKQGKSPDEIRDTIDASYKPKKSGN